MLVVLDTNIIISGLYSKNRHVVGCQVVTGKRLQPLLNSIYNIKGKAQQRWNQEYGLLLRIFFLVDNMNIQSHKDN
ncbi:MAG: hypothetical protein SRB1_00318 [Desulfobacteraceae bacterium Eth-SRB1]|nr:MAG: hypothetical protein SRB1_00318 [Desulfobacteraceae bacterium Eth-SRB1]